MSRILKQYEQLYCKAQACGVTITDSDINNLTKSEDRNLRSLGVEATVFTGNKIFRTRKSGIWNNHNIWEISGTSGFVPAQPLEYPRSTDNITIQSTHTVILQQNEQADLLFNNGTFITNNFQLTGTIIPSPSLQATNIVFSQVFKTSLVVDFTDGDGANRLVVCRTGSSVTDLPVVSTSYIANNVFGLGSDLGNSSFVVGAGSGPFTISGLTANTNYFFRAYEFNGSGGTENYMTATATGNPNDIISFPDIATEIRLVAEADYLTFDGGNLVSNWTDLSDVADDFVQGTGSRQPLWDEVDKVVPDGIDDVLYRDTNLINGANSLIIAVYEIGTGQFFGAGNYNQGDGNGVYLTSYSTLARALQTLSASNNITTFTYPVAKSEGDLVLSAWKGLVNAWQFWDNETEIVGVGTCNRAFNSIGYAPGRNALFQLPQIGATSGRAKLKEFIYVDSYSDLKRTDLQTYLKKRWGV